MTIAEYKQKIIETVSQMEQEHGEFAYVEVKTDRFYVGGGALEGEKRLTRVEYSVEIKF